MQKLKELDGFSPNLAKLYLLDGNIFKHVPACMLKGELCYVLGTAYFFNTYFIRWKLLAEGYMVEQG